MRGRARVPAAVALVLWLLVVAIPVYFIVVTSLRPADAYLSHGALPVPTDLSLDNYGRALRLGFSGFLRNSAIVTVATIALTLGAALPAAYAIVRNRSRLVRAGLSVFLFGLAIPAQAVIVPVYLIITRLKLYDSLTAIVLPTAAFSLPLAIVVLTSSLRDIPDELYQSMELDGAGNGRVFLRLVLPLSRPGLITVGIVSGLNAWNGILFPLVLTQSSRWRVLPLGLWNFQGQHGTDVPGLMAAVVLSALPMLALYLFGRRHLLRGLAAGFGR
ncbi:carbohydrate ABC transporter permease [Actinocatenispora comari]|uniref:ABC transporter permease n=1 Tax=Actinocatenispora comari TaxID=2807577 RepID=A0A8J4AH45_9ACTN|nr:carbohydrate ABC transporter permease [Actinocatenispora comari]GIL30525.1 ABC transporter permease [Actinocatenispora comari]